SSLHHPSTACHTMAKTLQERVDYAVSQLVERTVPVYPDEDDESAEQRLDNAYKLTVDRLANYDTRDAVASDVHHAPDLIKKKCKLSGRPNDERGLSVLNHAVIRDNAPDKALKFSHLYSRLLSQPVLNQKWAMLYFLYQLSDPPPPTALREATPSASNRLPNRQPGLESVLEAESESPEPTPKRAPDRQFIIDSPAFNDAFSNTGLLRLPQASGPDAPPRDRPVSRTKKDRPKDSKPMNGQADGASSPDLQKYPNHTNLEPSEPSLLRDLPFTLQGLSSTNL